MELSEEERTRRRNKGFTGYSGIVVTKSEKGYAEGEISIEEHHLNPFGSVHGGVFFTLADTIGGVATRNDDGFVCVTSSGNINFLNASIGSKKIVAKAKVLKHGRRLAVSQVDMFDENDKLLATAQMCYSNVAAKIN